MTDFKDLADTLAKIVYAMYEGDPTDDALDILQKAGYVDENQEWIYNDED